MVPKLGHSEKKNENKFSVFERKVLRRIYSPVNDNVIGEWRRRKNTELETLFNEVNVLEIIRTGRQRWAGHVCRNQNPLVRAVMKRRTQLGNNL